MERRTRDAHTNPFFVNGFRAVVMAAILFQKLCAKPCFLGGGGPQFRGSRERSRLPTRGTDSMTTIRNGCLLPCFETF